MSAHISKEEIALMMPERMGHYFRDEPDYLTSSSPRSPSVVAMLWSALNWVLEIPRRRAVLDELSALTDHELADIGISRSQLGLVFNPAFATHRGDNR